MPATCKHHGRTHEYVQHVLCGHQYCPFAWIHCPRCHGSDSSNMTDAYLTEQAHEEILAGLASERAHSRFREANTGRAIQWTYNGDGSMAKL